MAKQVEAVLTLSHGSKKRLKGKMQLDTAFAMSDIQQQLGNLIHKGFVTETGWQRCLTCCATCGPSSGAWKLAIDPNRDRVYMLKVHSVESEYKALLAKIPKSQLIPHRGGQYSLDDRGAAVSFCPESGHPLSGLR